tara:strand:- start:37 stop:357 length:321 start_codon:yes stop_codon:yes gene_type:complete
MVRKRGIKRNSRKLVNKRVLRRVGRAGTRRNVRVGLNDADHMTSKMMGALAVSLAFLTSLIIFISSEGPQITGNSVVESVYGSAAPTMLLSVLGLVIFLYVRIIND